MSVPQGGWIHGEDRGPAGAKLLWPAWRRRVNSLRAAIGVLRCAPAVACEITLNPCFDDRLAFRRAAATATHCTVARAGQCRTRVGASALS